MEAMKLSELKFDVLYEDGTKKRVENGILFGERNSDGTQSDDREKQSEDRSR